MHTELLENPKARNHLKDQGIDGRIIMYLEEIGYGGVDQLHLAQDG